MNRIHWLWLLSICLATSGCTAYIHDETASSQGSLVARIDRMISLLNEGKYELFVDDCVDQAAFAALLKDEGMTRGNFPEAMQDEYGQGMTTAEFLVEVFTSARKNVPKVPEDTTKVTVSTEIYTYPSVKFVKKDSTWRWLIWPKDRSK